MKKKSDVDELRPEYDLTTLKVAGLGPGRQRETSTVTLADDVAVIYRSSDAVNDILRAVIHATALAELSNPEQTMDLTDREIRVAQLLAKGMSNRRIAQMTGIREASIRALVTEIVTKLALVDGVAKHPTLKPTKV